MSDADNADFGRVALRLGLCSAARDRLEDLLGKLAVREGWITEPELRACLRAAKAGENPRSLLDVLMERGTMDPAGVEELKARLRRRRMSCPACATSFTVLSLARSPIVPCPRCRLPLAEGGLVPGRRTTPARHPNAQGRLIDRDQASRESFGPAGGEAVAEPRRPGARA
jgi:hypothetical protein